MIKLLNALCLAAYTAGTSAVGTFLVNTRIIGVRDGRIKQPAIVVTVAGLPVVGLVDALLAGGLGHFLPSLLRPFSWRWVWRVGFTLWGARYVAQEIQRQRHPPPQPE